MNILNRICLFVATLGPIGYLSAPGTMGTICAIPLVIWLSRMCHLFSFGCEELVVALFALLAVAIIHQALFLVYELDPSEIVLDEVIGFMVTMLWMPLTLSSLVFGFICFRFFDIVKPFGIDRLELVPGAWGIVLDDLAAAIFARLTMVVIMQLLHV